MSIKRDREFDARLAYRIAKEEEVHHKLVQQMMRAYAEEVARVVAEMREADEEG